MHFEFANQERLTFPIGILMPGEFRRIAQHLGFSLGWLWAGLPLPKKVVGTSCGAIGAVLFAMVAKYYKESPVAGEISANRTIDIVEYLRMSQIFTMPTNIKKPFAAKITASMLPLIPDRALTGKWRIAMRIVRMLASVGADAYMIREILRTSSIFSTEPLWRLFAERVDWDAVFSSPIEVEIITTDCRTGKGLVYSTRNPANQSPGRMATILCTTTRLTGEFPDRMLDGIAQADAEIFSCFPIERFLRNYGAVFFAPYTTEGNWPKGETNFTSDIARGFSIQVYNHMRRKVKRYLRIKAKDGRGRLPTLYVARTSEHIPLMTFNGFSAEAMRAGIEQGFRILEENLPGIMRTLRPLWVARP